MKKKIMFLPVMIALAVLIFWLVQSHRTEDGYTEKYVTLKEVREELSFDVYEKTDWDTFFAAYHREELTGGILQQLLTELGVKDYIEIERMGTRHAVTREEWNAVYMQILDLLDMEQSVRTEKLLILDVLADEEKNILVTNIGEYATALPVSYFEKWNAYKVYVCNQNCTGIAGTSEEEFVICNAYMTAYADDTVSFLYGGASYEKEIGALGAEVEEGVCDIVIREGDICALRMKQDTIQGELLSYTDGTIEIDGYGKVAHVENMPVYQIYGEVMEKSLSDVVLGNMEVTYVTGENQICAILIGQPASVEDIRVLLLAEDGTNFRQEVYLKCDTNATLSCGDKTENLSPETVIAASAYLADMSTDTLMITPDFTDGKVIVCDASGRVVSNGYHGTMEVRLYADGYTLVNEVPFETYLTAVVPSEMPSNYAPEALKAQAVCARSYAYIQLLHGDLAEFGAHINDSTSYQVYNKVEATEASKTAVYETAGQMILYEDMPVEAFYFSTSMGYTDTEEVWNVDDTYGYLKSSYLNTDGVMTDLSDDAAFLAYITQPAVGYDSDIKYYRWFAKADYRKKTAEINQILINRQAVSPKNIQFFKSGDDTALETVDAGTLDGFGKMTGISVQERSSAGSVLTLCVQYEKGSVLVKNEYNIRKVLGSGIEKIVYADSTESTSVTMLPSAFCVISEQEDGTVLLQGGGYGHGLGMSQNAANGMAKAGMNYTDILQYFYQNIKISGIE